MSIQILLGLFFCHFLSDYTHLSTTWMLNAKRLGKPLFPIFVHSLVHTILMGIFLLCILSKEQYYLLLTVLPLQLISHFLIDVWKGKMNVLFPILQSPANKFHWIIFGFDQYLHTVVIVIMTFILK